MRTEYRELVLRLSSRSHWQMAWLMLAVFSAFAAGGYWLWILPLRVTAENLIQQIQTQTRQVSQQQRVLLRQSSRAEWQSKLADILPKQASLPPLPQHILAPLNAAGGRMLHWLPEKDLATPDGVVQQGTFRLQLPYIGLVSMLQQLLAASSAPVAIEQLAVSPAAESFGAESLLDVTLRLAAYRGRISAQQKEQVKSQFSAALLRDPFSLRQAPRCRESIKEAKFPQLSGIIGSADNFTGWISLSAGEWFKAQPGRKLPNDGGRVEDVSAHQVRLTLTQPRCGEALQILTLAGQTLPKTGHGGPSDAS